MLPLRTSVTPDAVSIFAMLIFVLPLSCAVFLRFCILHGLFSELQSYLIFRFHAAYCVLKPLSQNPSVLFSFVIAPFFVRLSQNQHYAVRRISRFRKLY